jgi:hypothetical protein
MAKFPLFLKNKFTITLVVFFIYMFFLDDTDVFSLIHNLNKRHEINAQNELMAKQLKETSTTLKQLKNINYLESYARSKKFFKKESEDIFVITYK